MPDSSLETVFWSSALFNVTVKLALGKMELYWVKFYNARSTKIAKAPMPQATRLQLPGPLFAAG